MHRVWSVPAAAPEDDREAGVDEEDFGSERNMNLNNEEMRKWVHGEGPAALRVQLPTAQTQRDLTTGKTGKGGATVPSSFAFQLHEHLVASSAIRQTNVTVLRTESGEDISVPKTTAHGSAAIVAEGATIGESDPVFASTTLNAYKYGTVVQASSELVNDSGVDLVGYLAKQAGSALGNASGAPRERILSTETAPGNLTESWELPLSE